jgi:hypothetical protein
VADAKGAAAVGVADGGGPAGVGSSAVAVPDPLDIKERMVGVGPCVVTSLPGVAVGEDVALG